MSILTITEVREDGFTNPPFDDPRVTTAIERVQKYIEKLTGNWFEPRDMTIKLDGSGCPTLLLYHPIVSITKIEVSDVEVDSDSYVVYNRHLTGLEVPDDRKNPKIMYANAFDYGATGECSTGTPWPKGVQNISIEGRFAYRDYDPSDVEGQIPEEIKVVALRLLPRFIETAGGPYGNEAWRQAEVREKKSRGHYTRYGGAYVEGMIHGGLTGDIYVDRILAKYMSPVKGTIV